jgi:hypothetical protein
MEPDTAYSTPSGRQPTWPKKEVEPAPFGAHSKIDSIVLNAPPVADVYAKIMEGVCVWGNLIMTTTSAV